MRLRLRSRSARSGAPKPRGARATADDRHRQDRQPPAAVLTTWLRQGLRTGICPLCRVAHKADREYIWHFFDEGADQDDVIETVRHAFGFCAEHVGMLCRIEIDGMQSSLAISTMFADMFAGVPGDLRSMDPQAAFARARCPACANRDARVTANAHYLLDALATNPGLRERFADSPGLCFVHYEVVWSLARPDERAFIAGVQSDAAARLLADLSEHVRKHDHRHGHEPKGPEHDSWRRAVFMTAGWPPPAESASEPEARR